MDLYRAEARRTHNGHGTNWKGKWRKDRDRAVAQALRWRTTNPFAEISIVSTNGMKASLDELEAAQGTKP
jgi:hypothetical protein